MGTGPPRARAAEPVLVVIGVDPRLSGRAFEAMRIGVGIVSGENEVTFVLTGPAVHLLDAETDELVDGDDIEKFRATLRRLEVPFHIEESVLPGDRDWNADGHAVVPVSRARIAELIAGGRRVLVF